MKSQNARPLSEVALSLKSVILILFFFIDSTRTMICFFFVGISRKGLRPSLEVGRDSIAFRASQALADELRDAVKPFLEKRKKKRRSLCKKLKLKRLDLLFAVARHAHRHTAPYFFMTTTTTITITAATATRMPIRMHMHLRLRVCSFLAPFSCSCPFCMLTTADPTFFSISFSPCC